MNVAFHAPSEYSMTELFSQAMNKSLINSPTKGSLSIYSVNWISEESLGISETIPVDPAFKGKNHLIVGVVQLDPFLQGFTIPVSK